MIAAIWAQDENGLIGKAEKLPWYLPNDLSFFKKMTEDNTIVMGRKTFEGMGKRVLPNRQTIILTKDINFAADNIVVMHSVDEVLKYAAENEGITFITGGAAVYKEFMPFTEVLYRTVIHHSFEGDTYFPEVDWAHWTMVSASDGMEDEKNLYLHQFETYQQKNL